MKVKNRAESDMARALPERQHGYLFAVCVLARRCRVALVRLLTRPQASRPSTLADGDGAAPGKNGLTG
jgi:hypothetical protein